MKTEFIVKCAHTRNEVTRVAEFLESVFGHGRDYVLQHPDVQYPGSVRYVEYQGAIVSAHVLERMKLSLGCDYATAARIECIGTSAAFRRRGLCRLLMNDSVELLKSNGIQIALIFGEPLFRNFGFEYCIPTYEQAMPIFTPPGSSIIPTAALERFETLATIERMKQEDLPATASLYEKDNPSGNLSRQRPIYYWKFLVSHYSIEKYRVVRSKGEIVGYFRVESSKGQVNAKEVVAASQAACSTILHELYKVAKENNAEMVLFHCPHLGTFGRYLKMHGGAEYCPYSKRETNLQVQILDLKGCLMLLEGELSIRLQRSELANMVGRYKIMTEENNAVLEICKGRVDVLEGAEGGKDIRIPDRKMAQLISGFRVSEAIAECAVTALEKRLIEVLFPLGEPYFYVDDI